MIIKSISKHRINMSRAKRRMMHGKRLRRSAFKSQTEPTPVTPVTPPTATTASALGDLANPQSSPFQKKSVEQLELDREFKRKRRAKWYNRGDMSSADTYVAQDLDELATTGQFIPSQKAI